MEVGITFESVSTLISVVTFLFFNWVLTSARNSSPFFVPEDVIACRYEAIIHCQFRAYNGYTKGKLYGASN